MDPRCLSSYDDIGAIEEIPGVGHKVVMTEPDGNAISIAFTPVVAASGPVYYS